jgi:hypothetical protein
MGSAAFLAPEMATSPDERRAALDQQLIHGALHSSGVRVFHRQGVQFAAVEIRRGSALTICWRCTRLLPANSN